MNTDELKRWWKGYKTKVGEESAWGEEELLRLVRTASVGKPWYQAYQHAALNFCVVFLLMGLTTGC